MLVSALTHGVENSVCPGGRMGIILHISFGHFNFTGIFPYPVSYVLIPSTTAIAARYWRNTIGAWESKEVG